MKSDVILVHSEGSKIEKALDLAERVAVYKRLSRKSAMHLRLLTEEMMGMMRSITGETEGKFWIEDEDGTFELHLKVGTWMNSSKREQLLSASSSGKNESAKGLMGKLRDLFDRGTDADIAGQTSLMMSELYADVPGQSVEYEWTMMDYVNSIKSGMENNDENAAEAWDELEKSVVAHVADDVKVSIRGRQVEMTIIKKLTA